MKHILPIIITALALLSIAAIPRPILPICDAIKIAETKLEKIDSKYFIQSIRYIKLEDDNYVWRATYDTQMVIDKKDENISFPIYKYIDVDMQGNTKLTTERGVKRVNISKGTP